MSVSTVTNKIIYTGSGTTGPFDFDFKIYVSSDLVVEKYTIATGVTETLTETTDYVVTIDIDGTGYVTTVAAVTSSYKLIIRRVLPVTQEIDYVEGDKFPAETHEEGLDRSRMIDQQLQEQIDRCVKVSTGSTSSPDELIEDINDAVAAAQLAETAAETAQGLAETAQAAAELAAENFSFASQAEAEAGTIETKSMNPLRTAQAIAVLATSGVKTDGTVNPTNLLSNGDFESWSAGASAAPDGWAVSAPGGSIAREASIIKLGTYSAKLTRGGTDAQLYQKIHAAKGIAYWKGRTVTLLKWVYATVADRAYIEIYDGVGATRSTAHTGNSTWQLLTVTRTISASATEVGVYNYVLTGDTSAYFDGAMLVEGESAFAFSPKPAEFGAFTAKAVSGVYQAATDGIVVASMKYASGNLNIEGLSDASTPPTTRRAYLSVAATYPGSLCFPVKKGDYYQVVPSQTVTDDWMYFLPMGA